MCVRYTFHEPGAALWAVAEALGVALDAGEWLEPRFNVAPSQIAPVVAFVSGAPKLVPMRWGLIPPADRVLVQPRLLTNAKSETLLQRPAFREAASRRRCLIPANGFYEFKDAGSRKDPYLFTLSDAAAMAIAGVWEPPLDGIAASFCVVTTEPNATVAPLHHRMPVVLTAETMSRWVGDKPLAPDALRELARPIDGSKLTARRVNAYVNSSRHEGPKCLAAPEEDPPERQLGLGLSH